MKIDSVGKRSALELGFLVSESARLRLHGVISASMECSEALVNKAVDANAGTKVTSRWLTLSHDSWRLLEAATSHECQSYESARSIVRTSIFSDGRLFFPSLDFSASGDGYDYSCARLGTAAPVTMLNRGIEVNGVFGLKQEFFAADFQG